MFNPKIFDFDFLGVLVPWWFKKFALPVKKQKAFGVSPEGFHNS